MNDFLAGWALWMFERSTIATVALAFILLLAVLLRRRGSVHAMSYLALLPLVLLLCPIERLLPRLPGPWHVPQLTAPFERVAPATPVPRNAPSVALSPSQNAERNPAPAPTQHEPPLEVPRVEAAAALVMSTWQCTLLALFVFWATVSSLALTRFLVAEWHCRAFLRRAAVLPDAEMLARFHRLQARSGTTRKVALRIIPGLRSPALGGLLRPTIYAPLELMDGLATREQRWVLLHELAHARRRDLWAALLEQLVIALWFFHPAAWISRALAQRWRELACDESALAQLGSGARGASANALFHISSQASGLPSHRGSLVSLFASQSLVRTRIMRLLDSRHTPQSGLSLASFVLLFASTTVVLAAARYEAPLEQAALKTNAQSEVQQARRAAAQWIVSQQQADGRWMISAKADETVRYEFNEARTTAIAVRALLGEIKATPDANFERAMQRGVAYLESVQDAEGRFGSRDHASMMYAQGVVLRTLCEVDAHAPSAARGELLKRSVEFLLRAQNPYRGWRYSASPDGDNDSKITATILIALAAAEARGVEVHPQASIWGLEQLRDLTDPETGRTGFSSRGTPASRYSVKRDHFPSRYSEEQTAMQLLAFYAWGHSPVQSKSMRQGLALLTDCLPKWSVEDGSIDYSYWMEGAEAIARAGGYAADAWREALKEALVPHRMQAAEDRAHWPAMDAWSETGMEVYATATALLALQALT